MADLSIVLFGGVRMRADGVEFELPRRQVRGVLALLALNAPDAVSMDAIIDALWESHPPKRPTHAVHVYVNRLRRTHPVVADAVRTSCVGYSLDVPANAIDVSHFEGLLAMARAAEITDPMEALRIYGEALEVWKRPLCGDFEYAEFVVDVSHRLHEMYLMANEDRYQLMIAAGMARHVVPELCEMVRRYPYRDRLHRLFIEALCADGREIEAREISTRLHAIHQGGGRLIRHNVAVR